ncbi:MAG: hypothetical protein BJ554DRAFT_1802, partial [Olpidium bornovanus]
PRPGRRRPQLRRLAPRVTPPPPSQQQFKSDYIYNRGRQTSGFSFCQ